MYATTGSIFDQTVMKFRNKEAIVEEKTGKRLTFGEWQDEVHRVANALLDAGVRKGDRVSTYLFNTLELANAYFACGKIGAVINPINFRLKGKEIHFILEDAEPKVVLFEEALSRPIEGISKNFPQTLFWYVGDDSPEFAHSYNEVVSPCSTSLADFSVEETDIYAIMYTSGTTGRPKGVLHRHRDMAEQSLICTSVKGLTPNDIGLVTAPMFHCAELHCCFLPRVQAGAKNIIVHQFQPDTVLKVIQREKVTTLFAAPTMWNMLLQHGVEGYDTTSLRIGLYGAAPMAPVLVRSLHEKMKIDLIQAYGQTEMGPAVTFLLQDEQLTKAGSAGRAAYNHEIRVVRPNENGPSDPEDMCKPGEVGEIIVRGSCTMLEYFNRKEATDKALYKGWYHSSDLGYMDEEGYLYVADRVNDMVITGGENVYPREVEDALHVHEDVLDVAVLGRPDEKWGEHVLAVVVSKKPSLSSVDLDLFLKNGDLLADYKRPREYVFVEELPRNASGKIQKFLLRENLSKREKQR
ncbi:long-chain-fatty-acid--CoA ligase [Rossellomorea sp. SC111]|uniref:long-chain-fatty-acid--CoA ligase n=1 Tax=Rossellomorea sp. SC111 TaxID=2968985 RepID=UPI00215AE8C3|nr:long-chain-fatty-acid--CoA ligase [Rossellomorea sp. SC111]MCR8847358.1 long-chain-fatty-acid--CoA ligase [Rossellomorea sp. SC111]